MKYFLILTNSSKDLDLKISRQIRDMIIEKGAFCEILAGDESDQDNEIEVPEKTECILVIGGDGTILNAARRLLRSGIPIMGVNLGTLGFLADVKPKDLGNAIDNLLRNNYQLENRIMLHAQIWRGREKITTYDALNDFHISRKSINGPIKLTVRINGSIFDSYFGDGLILCTPTGSTGYNLSAGGPIINPTCKNFVLTPVCSHSLTARPIVLAKEDIVTVEIEPFHTGIDAVFLCDGRIGESLLSGDKVVIYKSDAVTPFVKMKEVSFVEILKEKLL